MSAFDDKRAIKISVQLLPHQIGIIREVIEPRKMGLVEFIRYIGVRVATSEKCVLAVDFSRVQEESEVSKIEEKRGQRIQILVTHTENALISNMAQRQGMTVSSFLRFVAMRVATNVQVEQIILAGAIDPEKVKGNDGK